jgi:hypothetical protein
LLVIGGGPSDSSACQQPTVLANSKTSDATLTQRATKRDAQPVFDSMFTAATPSLGNAWFGKLPLSGAKVSERRYRRLDRPGRTARNIAPPVLRRNSCLTETGAGGDYRAPGDPGKARFWQLDHCKTAPI